MEIVQGLWITYDIDYIPEPIEHKNCVIFFRVVFHLGIGLDGPISPVSLDDLIGLDDLITLNDPIGLDDLDDPIGLDDLDDLDDPIGLDDLKDQSVWMISGPNK